MNAISDLVTDIKNDATILRQLSAESDKSGYPVNKLANYVIEKGIHLALLPKTYGGEFFSPTEEFELILNASKISATFGWIVFQTCGNYGRVLSFFDHSFVRSFLNTKILQTICYHDNPAHGRLTSEKGHTFLEGKWPFGSLAKISSYFACPYFPEPGTKMCALVPRKLIAIKNEWQQAGMRGASTWSYELRRSDTTTMAIAPIRCTNPNFEPWYLSSRAATKHAAHGLGILHLISETSQVGSNNPIDVETWTYVCNEVMQITETARAFVAETERLILNGASSNVVQARNQNLSQFNRHLHSWLFEIAISSYQGLARLAPESRQVIAGCLRDTEALMMHIGIRAEPEHLLDYVRNSSRLNILKKNNMRFSRT